MFRREKGFTLIELLVVIAIIGILAAMLFPVFARARESARKIQCLSNVKNIAMAFQMYLTDYDRFNPSEHRADVNAYFNGGGPNEGCGCSDGRPCCTDRVAEANPYLKVPVILDEYIKNREVWSCPSARTVGTFQILNPYLNSRGTDDWFLRFQESEGECPRFRSCSMPFPAGWGGDVTDTITNGVWCTADGAGAFRMSVGVLDSNYDLTTSEVNDPARRVVCADAGVNHATAIPDSVALAYPDVCRLNRVAGCTTCCGGNWLTQGPDNCGNYGQASTCSPGVNVREAGTDPQYRKEHWPGRHLGGQNLGFADGHAKWMNSEQILFGGERAWTGLGTGELEGVTVCMCIRE